jgi:hypothetical protein
MQSGATNEQTKVLMGALRIRTDVSVRDTRAAGRARARRGYRVSKWTSTSYRHFLLAVHMSMFLIF